MIDSLDKIKYIESIANFDREAIDRLIEYSHDENLIVRYHAYRKLNSDNVDPQMLSQRDWELLPRGVLLNPGDIVWSVYQSGLTYDDSDYTIWDFSNDSGENIYREEIDVSCYDLWNREVAHKFISTHIDRASAQTAADRTIKEIIVRDEYPYSGDYHLALQVEEISQQDIYNLTKQYNISDLPHPQDSQIVKRDWWEDENEDEDRDELRWRAEDGLRNYAWAILEKLTIDEHYKIIDRIYTSLFGKLACVCKETVRETTYFKP
jgi:hypothetical protein